MTVPWVCVALACILATAVSVVDAECTKYAPVSPWDTCSSFAVTNGRHMSSIKMMNPALDCSKRLPNRLCVADAAVKLPPTCGKWDEVQYDCHGNLNDGCTPIAMRNQISDLRYLKWLNPHLDCAKLVPGELLCVQDHHRVDKQQQCIDWQEVVGDGKTDPCAGRPKELNTHLQCGKPLPKGMAVMACSDAVEVPMTKTTCTRNQAFIVDGKTNYCMLKGGKDKMPELVKHLQLNKHLYCSTHGSVGGTVLVCMEGYIQTVEEDVSAPGSPARDHIMLKLFGKLRSSPRLPSLVLSSDPFQGGVRGPSGTHTFMHATRKLPPGLTSSAAGLIHLAGAAIRAYKAHGNQIMAQSAWGALIRALALQDFSPDLFALQKSDPEFDRYINHMFLTHKRDVTCQSLTPAALKQPLLAESASCFCDPQQHILRCETLLNMAMMAAQKVKPIPSPHPSATIDDDMALNIIEHTTEIDMHKESVVNPFEKAKAAASAAKMSQTHKKASTKGSTQQLLTPEDKAVAEKIADELEMEAARAAGGDPSLGVMGSAELEAWHAAHNASVHLRHLAQVDSSKMVVDEVKLKLQVVMALVRKAGCKKLNDLINEGVDLLKKAVAVCTVTYNGDICSDQGACLSLQCPAVDLVIASVKLKVTLCAAFPRQAWLDCRLGCELMESGYSDIQNPQNLACPAACVRYLNDGYLDSRAEIQVDICLGGSALNLIKWLDDLVPDWAERALGIHWEKLLCFTLVRGGLNFPNGLAYLSLLPIDLGIIKASMDFTLQVYRPWHYPEICDCNASPWACQPYCLKEPGGVTFTGSLTVGINIDLFFFDLDLTKTWTWRSGFPNCGCATLPPKASELCGKGQGIVLPSSTCAACPAGMVSPNGGPCYACPRGSIPRSDGTNCLYCARGFIAATDGATQCVQCGSGLDSFPQVGGRLCRGRCPPGTELIDGGIACTPCPFGTVNPGRIIDFNTQSTGRCKPCDPGSAPNSARTTCDLCPPGLAASAPGSWVCFQCSVGQVPTNCQCKPYGFFNAPAAKLVTSKSLLAIKNLVLQQTTGGAAARTTTTASAAATTKTRTNSGQNVTVDFTARQASGGATGITLVTNFKIPVTVKWNTKDLVKDLLNTKKTPTLVPAGNAYVVLSPKASLLTINALTCAQNWGCKACSPCPPGTYGTRKAISCTPCAPGYYQPAAGKSNCIPCPSGTAAPSPGATQCTNCAAGTYSTGCRPAFVFKTIPDMQKYAPRNLDLLLRSGGGRRLAQAAPTVLPKFGFNLKDLLVFNARPTVQGCTECAPCLPGTYSPRPLSTGCTQCTVGTYQDKEGQTTCKLCPMATQAAYPAAIECHPCKQGNMTACGGNSGCLFYKGNVGAATCTKCPTGPSAPQQCQKQCPVGWYRPPVPKGTKVKNACLPCPAGSSTNTTEAAACQLCPPSTFNPYEGGNCTKCPAKTFSYTQGATSPSVCKRCASVLGMTSFFCKFPDINPWTGRTGK